MLREEETTNHGLDNWLGRHLYRVKAPNELWQRIQNRRAVRTRVLFSGNRLGVAAVLAVGMIAWGFYAVRGVKAADATLEQMLASVPRDLEFRSNQPAEIRTWVNDRVGLNIPLSDKPSSTVRLVGAHTRQGTPALATVVCTVSNNRKAILLVAKADSELPNSAGHRPISSKRVKEMQVSSWTMRGQYYILAAAPQDARAACGICHSEGEALSAFN